MITAAKTPETRLIGIRFTIAALLVCSFVPTARAAEPSSEKSWLTVLADESKTTAQEVSTPDQTGREGLNGDFLIMEGLETVGARKGLDALGLNIWGVVEIGFTGRLTGGQSSLPARVFEARRTNNLRLHQIRLILERPYDSDKSLDFGGLIEGMFGGDAMQTHSLGLFDKAGRSDGDAWADLVQAYGQLWIKTGESSGLEVTVGKFVTTHGAELIAAEGNALYSRSYLFGYAIPFTHTGVMANYVFSPEFSAYLAVVKGWDVFNDNNDAPSYMTGFSLSGKEQIDDHPRTEFFMNFITGPEQNNNAGNFRTVVDGTLSYWWTSNLSQSINADFGTEESVPGVGRARWYGVANYLTYIFNDCVSATWRAEWFRDDGGTRTGVDASYYENTLSLTLSPWPKHPVLKNLSLRPEIRWDFADSAAFGGGRRDQVTTGMDVVFKF